MAAYRRGQGVSVANFTRQDAIAFLAVAPNAGVANTAVRYRLEDGNTALDDLRRGRLMRAQGTRVPTEHDAGSGRERHAVVKLREIAQSSQRGIVDAEQTCKIAFGETELLAWDKLEELLIKILKGDRLGRVDDLTSCPTGAMFLHILSSAFEKNQPASLMAASGDIGRIDLEALCASGSIDVQDHASSNSL